MVAPMYGTNAPRNVSMAMAPTCGTPSTSAPREISVASIAAIAAWPRM